jgi:threonine/homoserine/homoserine lactone efflux protein
MTVEQMMAFLLFAVVAAVTPGPSNVMLTAAGANAGVLGGLPCLLGVTTGMGLMMFLVPLGMGSLVLQYPLALKILHWGGAAVLLWLSWKIATGGRIESGPGSIPVGYVGAAVLQWVNPKSWLVSASAAGTFLHADAGGPLVQAALLGALFSLAALPSCLLWLVFGAAVQRVLRSERRLKGFNITMAVLLVLSIALLAWERT